MVLLSPGSAPGVKPAQRGRVTEATGSPFATKVIEPCVPPGSWLVRRGADLQLRDSAGFRPDFPERDALEETLSLGPQVAVFEEKPEAIAARELESYPEPGQDGGP